MLTLTLGGLTGPENRAVFMDTLKMFEVVYGVPPVGMTIMPDGVRAMKPWMSTVDYDQLAKTLITDRKTIKLFGVTVSLGSAYTISG